MSDRVPIEEWANELLDMARLRSLALKSKRKQVWIGRLVVSSRPETVWATYGQVEARVKSREGPNPCTLQSAGMSCG